MDKIIEALCKEVDPDLAALMLAPSTVPIAYVEDDEADEPKPSEEKYFNWQLLQNPVGTILEWQRLRDRKKAV